MSAVSFLTIFVLFWGACCELSSHQQTLSDLWDEHCRYEFAPGVKSVEKTMDTMVEDPYVNHIPTLIGGVGKASLTDFYRKHFIFTNPDMTLEPVSRTVGSNSLVDEMIIRFVHDRTVDWMVPNVPPTLKTIEIPLVAIVKFREVPGKGWKLAHEHIYWDQASVLVQLGILDPSGLDVSGADQASKVRDPHSVPSNQLLSPKSDEL